MVEGRTHELSLGWCLVRNPGQKDVEDADFNRYAEEERFFRTVVPWSGLAKDRVGVEALRERLQVILAAHIRREFPKVKLEVSKKLKECRESLESLGLKRDTSAEQSRFLMEMATRFQALTTQALEAKYVDDCFSKHTALKIATDVANRNDILSDDFEHYGHTYQFNPQSDDSDEDPEETIAISLDLKSKSTNKDCSDTQIVAFRHCCSTRKRNSILETVDILHDEKKLPKPKPGGILQWMTQIYHNSRGFELGNFDPSLLATTMKAQSKNWDSLAFGYISDIATMTHTFIRTLLELVCPEANTLQQLESILMDELAVRYKKAFDHVDFIQQVERFGVPPH
ncbi:hypothetical protein MPH_12921 [Macrophomina phaseolina MS6]|uniref:Dynamin stalk domain-containing protein n=1 Tax=Macrophomina phaseolina (strain MS6) TaxID=1126212 RepID=K2QJG2_MACPH|nr:hypothetical protein MPH_12921 [Macrophomina phaseolina MS6]